MKRINDYFFITNKKKSIKPEISLCGKLEAIIGNYFLSGAGISDNDIQVLFYDSTVGFYEEIPAKRENIVAYILEKENIAFVREDMLEKLIKDTYEYGLNFIPFNSYEKDEFYLDREMEIPNLLKNITWIDDDFMNDETIEFDFETLVKEDITLIAKWEEQKEIINKYIVTLTEGRNRQIRRTFASLGYHVTNLHRTHFGKYELGDLGAGSLVEIKI